MQNDRHPVFENHIASMLNKIKLLYEPAKFSCSIIDHQWLLWPAGENMKMVTIRVFATAWRTAQMAWPSPPLLLQTFGAIIQICGPHCALEEVSSVGDGVGSSCWIIN